MQVKNLKEKGNLSEERYDHDRTRLTLSELADVVAHKSLLDARLSVITNKESPADSGSSTNESGEQCAPGQQPPPEETSLLSEIQYLYVKFCRDLTQDSKDKQKIDTLVDRFVIYFVLVQCMGSINQKSFALCHL